MDVNKLYGKLEVGSIPEVLCGYFIGHLMTPGCRNLVIGFHFVAYKIFIRTYGNRTSTIFSTQ